MKYLAVCVNTRYGRAGVVLSGTDESKLLNTAETMPNRIGYCGCESFELAIRRAGLMERDEKGAWGPIESMQGHL